jgi:hypothetical protein
MTARHQKLWLFEQPCHTVGTTPFLHPELAETEDCIAEPAQITAVGFDEIDCDEFSTPGKATSIDVVLPANSYSGPTKRIPRMSIPGTTALRLKMYLPTQHKCDHLVVEVTDGYQGWLAISLGVVP